MANGLLHRVAASANCTVSVALAPTAFTIVIIRHIKVCFGDPIADLIRPQKDLLRPEPTCLAFTLARAFLAVRIGGQRVVVQSDCVIRCIEVRMRVGDRANSLSHAGGSRLVADLERDFCTTIVAADGVEEIGPVSQGEGPVVFPIYVAHFDKDALELPVVMENAAVVIGERPSSDGKHQSAIKFGQHIIQ